jgi:hypothetical protein
MGGVLLEILHSKIEDPALPIDVRTSVSGSHVSGQAMITAYSGAIASFRYLLAMSCRFFHRQVAVFSYVGSLGCDPGGPTPAGMSCERRFS